MTYQDQECKIYKPLQHQVHLHAYYYGTLLLWHTTMILFSVEFIEPCHFWAHNIICSKLGIWYQSYLEVVIYFGSRGIIWIVYQNYPKHASFLSFNYVTSKLYKIQGIKYNGPRYVLPTLTFNPRSRCKRCYCTKKNPISAGGNN